MFFQTLEKVLLGLSTLRAPTVGPCFGAEDVFDQNNVAPGTPGLLADGSQSLSNRAAVQLVAWKDSHEADRKCFLEVMDVAKRWGNKKTLEEFAEKACHNMKVDKALEGKDDDMKFLRAMRINRNDAETREVQAIDALKKKLKDSKDESKIRLSEIQEDHRSSTHARKSPHCGTMEP